MPSQTDFINLFAPANAQERNILKGIYAEIGTSDMWVNLLLSLYIEGQLSIPVLGDTFNHAMTTMQSQFPDISPYIRKPMVILSMLFPHLLPEVRALLGKLRIFAGYFSASTATAILTPEFEYLDPGNADEMSPIDQQLAHLVKGGLLNDKLVYAQAGVAIKFYRVPDFVKNYLEFSLPPISLNDPLLLRFAIVYCDIASSLVENIQVDTITGLVARFLYRDIRNGLTHIEGPQHPGYVLNCAQIAAVLGDHYLADELRASISSDTVWEIDSSNVNAFKFGLLGNYYTNFHQVFPENPQNSQEQFDKMLFSAADNFVRLGVLRKVFFQKYDFLISTPPFVTQLTLTPEFQPIPEQQTRLAEAIDAALPVIKYLRQHGMVPEAALLTFCLGRAYALSGQFIKANTQFNNAIKLADEMQDSRLRGAAHLELAAVRIQRGHTTETNTLNNFLWAEMDFKNSGDLWNGSAAALASDVFDILSGRLTRGPIRSVTLLQESGLSHNAYDQTPQDIQTLIDDLSKRPSSYRKSVEAVSPQDVFPA